MYNNLLYLSSSGLLCLLLLGEGLLLLGLSSSGLGAELAAAPDTTGLVVLVVVVLAGVGGELCELVSVLLANVDDGDGGGGLLVDDLTEARLALDDDVRDAKLAAESGEPDNELDGVDVVGDGDELGLLLLNKGGDVVQAELDDSGGLRLNNSLGVLGLSLGSLQEASLLLGLALGLVLVEELEESGGCNGATVSAIVSKPWLTSRMPGALGGNVPWFLSRARVNWAIDGGTLRRWYRRRFWRWRRTYLGQRTKRVRSRLGWMSPPTPKLRGRRSKR